MLERLLRAQREVLSTRQVRGEQCRTLLRHLLPTIAADVAMVAHWKPGGRTRFLHEPGASDGQLRKSLQAAVKSVLRAGPPAGNGHARPLLAMLQGPAGQRAAAQVRAAGVSDAVLSVVPASRGTSLVCVARNSHSRGGFSRFERILLHLLHASCAAAIADRAGETELDGLSPRATEITALLLKGLSERRIAETLGVSRSTVHTYVIAIYRKHGVHSRAELAYRLLGK